MKTIFLILFSVFAMAQQNGWQDLPAYGSASWKNPVASAAQLPLSGNNIGDVAVAKDTGIIYEWNGASWQSGSGTVTSVGLALPSIFNVTGSPVTGSGTLTGTFINESVNTVFAGPASGPSAVPVFRSLAIADLPVLTANTFAGFDGSGSLESVPGFTIDTTSGGMTINLTQQPNNGGGGTVNNGVFNFDPLQNSPNENWNIYNLGVSFDVNNSGFSQGTNGNAVQLLNLGFNHSNTGPIGQLVYLNLTGSIGNGTDPLTTNGMVLSASSLNYHANVTLNNSIQGYTFNPVVDAAAIAGTNFGVTAFSDSSNIGISVDGYSSANFNPNVAQVSANHGLTGLNFNPMVTTMGANAFVHGMDIGGTITTSHGDVSGINITPIINGGDADFHGINITPSGTATLASVNGINIDLSNLASPNIKNGLSINGASINAASPYDTSILSATPGEFQNNSLGGEFHIAAGHPMSASFGFGNNLGFTLLAEDDMVADNFLGSSSLGFSLNGFVNQVVVLSGKTVDTVNYMAAGGSSNVLSTGGTIANVSMFRALGVLNGGGSLNITNMYGFKAEPSLSGLSPTNTWGVWVGDTNADNWFAKNVVIGGATGKPTASFDLDVTGTAVISDTINVGTGTIAPFAGNFFRQDADATGQAGGIYVNHQATRTINGFSLDVGGQLESRGQVDTGISNGGGAVGAVLNAYRNSGASDAGDMGYLVGAFVGAHQSSTVGTTAILSGIFTQQDIQQGTVTDAYDIFAAPASTGATITNRWGIYISPDVAGKVNFLADKLVVGHSYVAPMAELTINGAGFIDGQLDMNTHNIVNVVDPANPQDAATKNYVDTVASQLQPIQAVSAASVANVSGTYLNGASGIGATFTTTSVSTFVLDGYTPGLNERVLLKDQSTGFQNGVYTVTQLATGLLPAILTRSLDYDTATDIDAGNLIPTINGITNIQTSWLQTAAVNTVGTDALVFVEWTANPANYLLKYNNLSDVASPSSAFNNISPVTSTGDLILGNGANSSTRLAIGSSGKVLTSDGTTASWQAPAAGSVGILCDLSVGPAQIYTTIASAITAASAGQSICIQSGVYAESPSIGKQLQIYGSGRGVEITGSLTIASGGDYSLVQQLKVDSGIAINSGVSGVQLLTFWSASGQTVTDNGSGSYIVGMQE